MNSPNVLPPVSVTVAALLPGVFHLTTSYAFYNLNQYKMLVAWCSCALLLVLLAGHDLLATRRQVRLAEATPSRWLIVICLLPLVATLPGLWLTQAQHAYFLAQESGLWLICCGWMLLLIRLLDDAEKLAEFLLALAVIVTAVALLALWRSLGNAVDVQDALAERESGSFGNPNFLACFLVMHIPLFGLCALSSWQVIPAWRGKFYIRLIFLMAAATALFALFFTQSRVAMATLVAIVGALLVLMLAMPGTFPLPVRRAGGLLAGILLLTSMAAPLLFPEITEALTSALRSTPESRLVAWRAAWASIADAPWFGWGQGSSYSLFFQYVDPASRLLWHERSYAHPHNEVLEILQEGGVFGLCAYLVFIAVVVRTIMRLLLSDRLHHEYKAVVIGIGCALLAYHIAGLASVDSRMAVVRFSLFTLLALVFSLQRLSGDAPQSTAEPLRESSKRGLVTVYAGVLLMLVTSAILLLPDLESRFRFVDIMQRRDSAVRQQLLEDLRDDNPNVYALEQLVQAEIADADFDGATLTLHKLDALIPNYSISGYFKAVNLLLQNQDQQAMAAALSYQARDLYLPQTAHLLAKIAVMRDEQTLLLQQLRLLLTPLVISSVGLPHIESASVVVESTPDPTTCTIATAPAGSATEVKLRINNEALAAVMRSVRTVFDSTDPTPAIAAYQNLVAGGVNNLDCAGLNPGQQNAFRSALQQILLAVAQRDL